MAGITKGEVVEIAQDAIDACRREVDRELIKLHEQDRQNAWTEERAAAVAKEAASMAVKQITDNFYMGVGKKTVATIGVLVVGLVVYLREELVQLWLTIKK